MIGRKQTAKYAIIGEYSEGKTLLMTAIGYRDHLKGIPVYSNYHLEYPHTHISTMEDLEAVKNGTVLLDEAWYTFDSRSFGTKENKGGSYILSKLSKRNCDLYLNMQSMDLIDNRFRDRLQAILIPQKLLHPSTNNPFALEVSIMKKDKWGTYTILPSKIYFDVSEILSLYDTSEELDPLKYTAK